MYLNFMSITWMLGFTVASINKCFVILMIIIIKNNHVFTGEL